jgi:hypothetical protein
MTVLHKTATPGGVMPLTGQLPVDPAMMMQGDMGAPPLGAPEAPPNPFLLLMQQLMGQPQGQPADGMPLQDHGPPPGTFVPIPKNYRKPSHKHIEHADEYVKAWIKRSAEYIHKKVRRWNLFEDLYWNRRFIDQWNKSRCRALADNRARQAAVKAGASPEWKSRQVVSIAPTVDNYTQELQSIIFTAKDFFIVRPSPKNPTGSIEDMQYPTSRKIQQKLLATCNDLQIKTRVYEFLQDGVIFGTALAKCPWVEEYETIEGYDRITGEPQTRTNRYGTARLLILSASNDSCRMSTRRMATLTDGPESGTAGKFPMTLLSLDSARKTSRDRTTSIRRNS